MLFHLLLVVLALALTSATFPISAQSHLPTHGNTSEMERAAATMSLLGNPFALGLNEEIGQSLSNVWDLPTGQLFCNDSSGDTINHNYVTTLTNTLYASKANTALLRAVSGEVWKITHTIGTLQGTQICKSHPPLLESLRSFFPNEHIAEQLQSYAISASTTCPSVLPNTT